jgi:hypothetical protein|tara:strand:- start:1380 stop:1796 length:417 start_codon:yes stop_codon:yes gene_type:complete
MKIDKEQFNIVHHKIGTKEDKLYTSLAKAKEFDSDGYPITDDVEQAYARATCNKKTKHITDRKKNYSYYIKCNPNQEAFDPRQLHTPLKDKALNNFIDSVCKDEWRFKEVDHNIFNKYLSFLKNESVVLLKDINRSLK